jgi:hypothetical protein
VDEFSVTPVRHQACAPQMLKMLRGIRDRQTSPVCQYFDAALALRQLLQKFKSMGVPKRFRHCGEFNEQRQLWTAC